MTKVRRYLDLSLELRSLDQQSDTFELALSGRDVGEPPPVRVPLRLADLEAALDDLESKRIERAGLIALGQGLSDRLLPEGAIRGGYELALSKAGPDSGVRLRLIIRDAALAQIPWEYVYIRRHEGGEDEVHFLVLDPRTSIVRHPPLGEEHPTLAPVDPTHLRLVAALASPAGHRPRLRLGMEKDVLEAALSDFDVPDVELDWQLLESPTPKALIDGLAGGADLFHFAGHGEFVPAAEGPAGRASGRIVLEGDDGDAFAYVNARDLAIRLREAGARLALVGACRSGRQDGISAWAGVAPALIEWGVPAVVAMQYKVLDSAAIKFTGRFYASLAHGLSVDEAVFAGRQAMLERAGDRDFEWGVPVLHMRAADGVLFPEITQLDRLASEEFRVRVQQRVRTIGPTGRVTGYRGTAESLAEAGSIDVEEEVDTVEGEVVGVEIDPDEGRRGARARPPDGRTRSMRPLPEAVPPEETEELGPGPGEHRGGGVKTAEPEGPRWIQTKVFTKAGAGGERELTGRGFLAGAQHRVRVMVGRLEDWPGALAAAGAPGESVDAKLRVGEAHELTVMLFVPTQAVVQTVPITLPAEGPTAIVGFDITAPPTGQPVSASVSLIHRGRVLQTAVLSGWSFEDPGVAPPGFEMVFKLAVIKPQLSDLEARQPFDAAVVSELTPKGLAVAGVGETKPVQFDHERLRPVVDRIRTRLASLADIAGAPLDQNDAKTVDLLRALAFQGRDLYDILGVPIERAVTGRNVERIQVVSGDAGDFVPVEFVYDLPTPSQRAGLCPNWQKALADGLCDPSNHPPTERPGEVSIVCPLGFWGLRKVIERHVVTSEDELLDNRTEPTAERGQLAEPSAALFAWSDRVNNLVAGQSDAVLTTLKEVTGTEPAKAAAWEDWVAQVHDRQPSLLVLLSHTVTEQGASALEIGPEDNGSRCLRVGFTPEYVKTRKEDAPIVMLLGCDTAVARSDPETFVARFREIGAALVVGTLSPVLGEHAAPVASGLIREMRAVMDRGNDEGVAFGEAMLHVRRSLLAKGELTALCVTSFGDADWRLGGPPG